jgi:hypothetical protein
MAVERMRSSDNIGDLAEELDVGRRVLYKWPPNSITWSPEKKRPGPTRMNHPTGSKCIS